MQHWLRLLCKLLTLELLILESAITIEILVKNDQLVFVKGGEERIHVLLLCHGPIGRFAKKGPLFFTIFILPQLIKTVQYVRSVIF